MLLLSIENEIFHRGIPEKSKFLDFLFFKQKTTPCRVRNIGRESHMHIYELYACISSLYMYCFENNLQKNVKNIHIFFDS